VTYLQLSALDKTAVGKRVLIRQDSKPCAELLILIVTTLDEALFGTIRVPVVSAESIPGDFGVHPLKSRPLKSATQSSRSASDLVMGVFSAAKVAVAKPIALSAINGRFFVHTCPPIW
jgi:hypothetical protein